MFDGSGDHTWYVHNPTNTPADDPRREIRIDVGEWIGGITSTVYTPPEGPVVGSKYYRADYRLAGGIAAEIRKSDGELPATSSYGSIVLTFGVRNAGRVYNSKLMEFYTGNNYRCRIVYGHNRNTSDPPKLCFWDADFNAIDPDVTPRASGTQYISNNGPTGEIRLQSNVGGPVWYIGSFEVERHPCELGSGSQSTSAVASSNQWWRYTVRLTRETASGGDGRIEVWQWGSHPGAGPGTPAGDRRTTAVKIFDWNGASGQCANGSVYTAAPGQDLLDHFFIGGTTDGHCWPCGTDGCYIDWDYVRIWTEE
jgi:hypothetical protein